MLHKKIIVLLFMGAGLLLTSFIKSQPSKDNKVDDAFSSKYSENVLNGMVVLELFTSQGCSSCPPADDLLQEVKIKYPENVFVLSYHVDYWNYIGWTDPFSNKEFTEKQSSYNRKFGYRGNYTPELVVNGKEHLVGSNRGKVINAINKYSAVKSENQFIVQNLKRGIDKVNFDYNIVGNTSGKTARAVLVLNERTTQVKRGENRQRTLVNSNIVVAEKSMKIEDNSLVGAINIPSIVKNKEELILMLLIENRNGDIIGAVNAVI
ncbi:DUF1223 domain-containing protein [Maribacter sp.]|uniref:DUF1223 domain-containing protein n=1 Tax=Maribacter sp. TaxID=1897614 RepID=UPI003298EF21